MESIVELDTGKRLMFSCVSAREVVIKHHSLTHVDYEKNEDKNIISLTFDNYKVSLGDVISVKLNGVKNKPFKVLYIKKSVRADTYILYSTVLTKATRWIMPMIRIDNQTQTSMKYGSSFTNCYVGTKEEGYMDNFYLVYRFSGNVEYIKFEEELKNHPKFSSMVDLDRQHVMYIFNMNEEDKFNFKKFKNGEYSKFTDKYKKQILNFTINPVNTISSKIEDTITYGVLYKTDKQKKRIEDMIGQKLDSNLEYYSIPEENNEVYTGDIEIPKESIIEQSRYI